MNPVMQLLLIVSYAVVGLSGAFFLPMAGIEPTLSRIIGACLFFGLWQIQISFFNQQTDADDPRLEALEKLVLKLRKELDAFKTQQAETDEKGAEKDKKLVSELQTLQAYLMKIMSKEAGKEQTTPSSTLQPTTEPEDHSTPNSSDVSESEQLSDEEIEELGLAPEEAAMIVLDDGGGDGSTGPAGLDDKDRKTQSHLDEKGATPLPSKAKNKAKIRLIKREDQLLSVVKDSLSENRIDLYLQPIVGLPSRKTVHYECFSRVRDEEGRIVLPRQYMKIAETKGLIGTIDNLLLFRLIQLVRKLGKRHAGLKFFCNMSRYSIADPEFFPQFIDFMASNEEFADRLVFEISQEDYLTLDDDTLERLNTLGRRGFSFSMDLVTDFNQNFSELSSHHFKFIKSDLKSIRDSLLDKRDISEQLAYLRRHGMQWIASRVENEEMVIDALDNKIELSQGYLFGEPRSVAEMNDDL